jgi:hypothetical protein
VPGFAAGGAGNSWDVGMQPGFELKEVQMPPRATQPIVDALVGTAAMWTGQQLDRATNLEIDASPVGV